MTLVVVDEVQEYGTWGHFGSKVAGPVAARLLRLALGLEEQPAKPVAQATPSAPKRHTGQSPAAGLLARYGRSQTPALEGEPSRRGR
jgi:hypothetical protein